MLIDQLLIVDNPEKMIAPVLNRARNGDKKAQYWMANQLWKGHHVKQSKEKALEIYRILAEDGCLSAQKRLAFIYEGSPLMGTAIDPDPAEAFKWNLRVADQGYPEYMYNVGEAYHEGSGVPYSIDKTIEWWTKAAESGYMYAIGNLADLYFHEIDSDRHYLQAAYWYRIGARRQNPECQRQLGFMYYSGLGLDRDLKKAYSYISKAAERDDKPAMHYLGLMYCNGEGVDQDVDKGLDLMATSAILRYRDRLYCKWMQCLYEMEPGLSSEDAEYYCSKADRWKTTGFAFDLARMYYHGIEVKKNLQIAAALFIRAARSGSQKAEMILGKMYKEGIFFDEDPHVAEQHFLRAESSGCHFRMAFWSLPMRGESVHGNYRCSKTRRRA